MRVKEFSRRQE